MKTLRNLAVASSLGLLLVGPASAMTTGPRAAFGQSASAMVDDTAWTYETDLMSGRSVHEDAQHHPMRHYRALHHHKRHDRVHANGFCNGRSNGSGDHSCGTATGGPVGGNPSRN